ncbi:MAG: DUF4295 family protein [Candidatus Neomarinimicrobiota bacterium]
MAKGKRSFADKARKYAERSKAERRYVRVVKSVKDSDTGAVRFSERMVAVPSDVNIDEYLRQVVEEEN